MPIPSLPAVSISSLYTFAARLVNLLVSCLARAGVVRDGVWLWTLVFAPIFWIASISGNVAGAQGAAGLARVDADRAVIPETAGSGSGLGRRLGRHESAEWQNVAAHLPDPATASGDRLELAADLLRARRMPEDAIDFYTYALRRGGDEERLLNKLGITELGMRDLVRARAYLKLAVKRYRRNADAWNNLGATEYVDGQLRAATSDYRKAVKLNGRSAVFHANLAISLMEGRDFKGARKEFSIALDLDPEMERRRDNASGISARVLSGEDRARYCLELARVYATKGMMDAMLHSLAMAAENGVDLRVVMASDRVLEKYSKDPQVVLLMQNAEAMKHGPLTAMAEPAALAAEPVR